MTQFARFVEAVKAAGNTVETVEGGVKAFSPSTKAEAIFTEGTPVDALARAASTLGIPIADYSFADPAPLTMTDALAEEEVKVKKPAGKKAAE